MPSKKRFAVLLSALLVLSGCASVPPPYETGAAGAHKAPAMVVAKVVPQALHSAAESKAPVSKTEDLCHSVLGQTQSYLTAVLATDREIANGCVRKKGRDCWSGLANTITEQQAGLAVLPEDCSTVHPLQRLGSGYLQAAGRVARDCSLRGAPKCLSTPQADTAMRQQKALQRALGGQ
jgi:hypothetical protein